MRSHKESTKSGVIKGYTEREKALCDPQYLKEENIEEVFEENGYSKKEFREAMQRRDKTS